MTIFFMRNIASRTQKKSPQVQEKLRHKSENLGDLKAKIGRKSKALVDGFFAVGGNVGNVGGETDVHGKVGRVVGRATVSV